MNLSFGNNNKGRGKQGISEIKVHFQFGHLRNDFPEFSILLKVRRNKVSLYLQILRHEDIKVIKVKDLVVLATVVCRKATHLKREVKLIFAKREGRRLKNRLGLSMNVKDGR